MITKLIGAIAAIPEVVSMGKSGGPDLPPAGEGDIDIFVFCDTVPDVAARRAAVCSLSVSDAGIHMSSSPDKHWGTCDRILLGDMEICLMYFTVAGMNDEIESILSGKRLDREDNCFYPTGRCASFLRMHILHEKRRFIAAVQNRLSVYPEPLAEGLISYHLEALADTEDLERAKNRKDTLFYHFALDLALDHFLQALSALNRCFFPSRKRTADLIGSFPI